MSIFCTLWMLRYTRAHIRSTRVDHAIPMLNICQFHLVLYWITSNFQENTKRTWVDHTVWDYSFEKKSRCNQNSTFLFQSPGIPRSLSAYLFFCGWNWKWPKSFIAILNFWTKSGKKHSYSFVFMHGVLKITEKVSFNIASGASYFYILSGQKLIKNAKNGPFWLAFENLKLAVKQFYQTHQL